MNKNSDVQLSEREKKNALQIVHLCLAQSEIAKAFDDGRAVPFVELESDCFVPAWLCIRPVITQAQRGQILDDLTFEIGLESVIIICYFDLLLLDKFLWRK